MATRRRKSALEEELMTDSNLLRVIGLLEPTKEGEKPITKKLACELLGMTYNTARLTDVIEQFKAKRERERKFRAAKRGKPATKDETVSIIADYLGGSTIDSLSKTNYRSPGFVKDLLIKHNVPMRSSSQDYFHPMMVPDEAMRSRFAVNETVYSARYDSIARIEKEDSSPKHGWIYRIWLLDEKWQQYAWQEATELASLQHLRELGVRV